MPNRKQQQALIDALKFTPRDIEITLSGYGGEIVIGRISEAAYDYWQDRDDLGDFVYDWDGDMDVPADARFCTDGAWHDVDDVCHESGCEASDACWITVTDLLENQDLFESNLDLDNLRAKGVDTAGHGHCRPDEDEPNGQALFLGQSIEKGTFFSGTVRITQPFDPSRLSISWQDCDGWRLISGVEYDGEEVEGYDGYSTTGKGMEFKVYRVERDDDDIPVLEGEEMWAQEAIDADTVDIEPELWEGIPLTPWWPVSQDPVREGEYEVIIGTWPFPQRAHWDGVLWKQIDQPVIVNQWRGLSQSAD
jgi:hypothetical protein